MLPKLICLSILCATAKAAFVGEGTVYSSDFRGGNCDFTDVSTKAKKYFAAINDPQFDKALACGLCAKMTCVDSKCGVKNPVTVQITDRCPGCKHGDIDMSHQAWVDLTAGKPYDRFRITWDWVSCAQAGFNSGSMKLYLKDGSHQWWYAFQPRNHNKGIKNIFIGQKRMKPPTETSISSFYFLNDGTLPSGPFTITVEAANGEKKSKMINGLWKPATELDLGFNF